MLLVPMLVYELKIKTKYMNSTYISYLIHKYKITFKFKTQNLYTHILYIERILSADEIVCLGETQKWQHPFASEKYVSLKPLVQHPMFSDIKEFEDNIKNNLIMEPILSENDGGLWLYKVDYL
jgi:hypothetical protein